MKLECMRKDLVVDRFHTVGERVAGVVNSLLANLPPTRFYGGVVGVTGEAVQHVAWPDAIFELWRIVWLSRVLHRVEVVKVTEEFVEAVNGGEVLVPITSDGFCRTDRWRSRAPVKRWRWSAPLRDPHRSARLTDRRETGPDGELPGDEVRASGRAARLRVIVGEQHPLRS